MVSRPIGERGSTTLGAPARPCDGTGRADRPGRHQQPEQQVDDDAGATGQREGDEADAPEQGVDAAVLGQAAADAAEDLVGPAAAQLGAGRRTGRRGWGCPGGRVEGRRRGRGGGWCRCHGQKTAERRSRKPSGKAPIRPWFLFRGDSRVGPGFAGATIGGVTITATGAPPRPPLARPQSGRVLAGVAAGTAAHLRQDPVIVRVAFAVLSTVGIGIVAYMLLWLTMPVAAEGWEEQAAAAAPRLEPRTRRQWAGIVVLAFGAAALLGQVLSWGNSDVVLPLMLAVGGLVVIWRQLDTDRALDVPAVRWALAGGVALAAGGVILLLATTGQLANARNGFVATLVILIGVVLRHRAALAAAAGLACARSGPVASGRRSAPRSPPTCATLRPADARAHPASRRRAPGRQPARPQSGARAAGVALRPEGRPGGRHLGRAGGGHGRRRGVRPRAHRRPGRRGRRPHRRGPGRPWGGYSRGAGERGQALGRQRPISTPR